VVLVHQAALVLLKVVLEVIQYLAQSHQLVAVAVA
jgi:hypothetical protein